MPIPTLRDGKITFIEGALYPKSVIGREGEIESKFSTLMENPLYELDSAREIALEIYEKHSLPTKAGVYLVKRDGSCRAKWVCRTLETAMQHAPLMLQCKLGRANLHTLAGLGFLLAPSGESHAAASILSSLESWQKHRAAGQHDAATKFAIDAVVQARSVALEITQADNLTVGQKCRSAAAEGGQARKASHTVQRKVAHIRGFIENYRARHPEAPVKQIYRDFEKSAPAEHMVKLSRFYEIAKS